MSQGKSRPASKGGRSVKRRPSTNIGAAATPPPTADAAQRNHAPALADRLLPLLLAGIGLAAYYNSFDGVFLLDDEHRIVNGAHVRQLWPPWVPMVGSTRPILDLSLAANFAAGGLNPWGYHAFNLAVHVLAGLLLFGIVRRMLESEPLRARYGGASRWLAAAVAAIWLAHPLQTESVTYVIQRAESLMGLFFLLTMYCGIRASSSRHPGVWSVAAVAACALGMGSKEVMVSAPILMLLYDRMFVAKSFIGALRHRPGLYAGLAATWLVLVASLVIAPADLEQLYLVAGINPWSYALTQFEVIVHYLRLSLWPDPLIFDYTWPVAEHWSSIAPAAGVVLALLGGTVYALRKRLWVGFWGAWFFLILAPTSSVMPIADVAFEHRMYLPLAAVVVILVIGGHDLLARLGPRLHVSRVARGSLEAGLVVAMVAALVYATVRRNVDYRSELAMWSDTVAKRPGNPRAHTNLGVALYKQGKTEAAGTHYREALRLKPDYVDALIDLGAVLIDQGRNEDAIAALTEALRLKPGDADAHNTLGVALKNQGKFEDAVAQHRAALRLKPGDADAQLNLGVALIGAGRNDEGIDALTEVLRLKPGYAEAHNNLGVALKQQGKTEQAIAHYREALRQKPDYVDAQINLGAALIEQGRSDEAIAPLTAVLRLKPDYAEAHNNLGAALFNQGKVEDAIEHFARAVRLRPDFTEARENLRMAEARLRGAKRAQ